LVVLQCADESSRSDRAVPPITLKVNTYFLFFNTESSEGHRGRQSFAPSVKLRGTL